MRLITTIVKEGYLTSSILRDLSHEYSSENYIFAINMHPCKEEHIIEVWSL